MRGRECACGQRLRRLSRLAGVPLAYFLRRAVKRRANKKLTASFLDEVGRRILEQLPRDGSFSWLFFMHSDKRERRKVSRCVNSLFIEWRMRNEVFMGLSKNLKYRTRTVFAPDPDPALGSTLVL